MEAMKYCLRYKHGGEIREKFESQEEANQEMLSREADDKELGLFIPDYYEVTEYYSYDVCFDDGNNSNSKGAEFSLEEAMDYIKRYNGTDESYFSDYKGGIVSIYCHQTGENVYEEVIR